MSLGLGIVKVSRFSPRRADSRHKRPARRIARWKAFLQTFVELAFGDCNGRHFWLALAPPVRRAVPGSGPRCHISGRAPCRYRTAELRRAHDTPLAPLGPRGAIPNRHARDGSLRALRAHSMCRHCSEEAARPGKRSRGCANQTCPFALHHTPRYAACTRASAKSSTALPLVAIRPVSTT
jgi:hypothetical protein